jgi:hypothetical protein
MVMCFVTFAFGLFRLFGILLYDIICLFIEDSFYRHIIAGSFTCLYIVDCICYYMPVAFKL